MKERIFSGDYSASMWEHINKARTVKDLSFALYVVCCRLQELEARIAADSTPNPAAAPSP